MTVFQYPARLWQGCCSYTPSSNLRHGSNERDSSSPTESVLFSVIVTPTYSHRVHSLQALERLSQPSSHDDGKPGDDDGKQYRSRVERGGDP